MGKLNGRIAAVTGAATGLGRAIALLYAAEGADVAVLDRNGQGAEIVAARIRELGRRSLAVTVDVGDEAAVRLAFAAVEAELGSLDILVNNAGIVTVSLLDTMATETFDEMIRINLKSVFLCSRAVLPGMTARGDGDVINIASVSGKRPLAHRTPYCASKMAVIGLTSTLAFEVGPAGVRVNTLSPGPVSGPRMARNFRLEAERSGASIEAAEAAFVSRAALGRMVTEEEVGAAVLAMLGMPGLCGSDVDLSAGMIA